MEHWDQIALQRSLRHFDSVWRRVEAGRSPRQAAERRGLKLMPRQDGRRRCR